MPLKQLYVQPPRSLMIRLRKVHQRKDRNMRPYSWLLKRYGESTEKDGYSATS